MKNPLIEFRNVTKRFGEKTVLDRVNLKIYENEVTTIIGKSGTGKTVLLKHVIGLLRPDEGAVLFRGKPLTDMKRSEWRQYKQRISYLFQYNALFDSMTVFENVALAIARTTSLRKEEISDRVMRRIEQTELTDAVHKYPAELSGGMQKRAALARALVTDPAVVLFDEPTTGQDPIRKNVILSMIAHNRKKLGFTAVLISHDIPDVFFISDRLVLLWQGTVGFEGTCEEALRLSHPMMTELKKSLEGLQEEVVGLHMKKSFRSCYAPLCSDESLAPAMSAIRHTLEFDPPRNGLSADGLTETMRMLGEQTARHFRHLGFFSVIRHANKDILTLLSHAGVEEAEQLMVDHAKELQERTGMVARDAMAKEEGPDRSRNSLPCRIRLCGGVTEVSFRDDIDDIATRAGSNQRVLAVFGVGAKEG